MSKLYIVMNDDAVQPLALCATKRAALKVAQKHKATGGTASIEEEDVPMQREAVVEFVNRRFGTAIFE